MTGESRSPRADCNKSHAAILGIRLSRSDDAYEHLCVLGILSVRLLQRLLRFYLTFGASVPECYSGKMIISKNSERSAIYEAYDFSAADFQTRLLADVIGGSARPLGTFWDDSGKRYDFETDSDRHCIICHYLDPLTFECSGVRAALAVIIYPPKVAVETAREFVRKTALMDVKTAREFDTRTADLEIFIEVDIDVSVELARVLLLKVADRMQERWGSYGLRPLPKTERGILGS